MFEIAHGQTHDSVTNRGFDLLLISWSMQLWSGNIVARYLKFDTHSTNPLDMFLFILSHAFMLQYSRKIALQTRQSNTTHFNNWHSTLLHISIPKESATANSYKTFKTSQFFVLFYPCCAYVARTQTAKKGCISTIIWTNINTYNTSEFTNRTQIDFQELTSA
jgi:hypothetical protein